MSNLSQLRSDGRYPDDLRAFEISWDPMGFAKSSLIVRTGQTAVLCSVSLKEGVPSWLDGKGQGWLSAEYRLLPGSTPIRQEREIIKLSGRTQEIQRLIGRTLRAVVDLKLLNHKTLVIDCDVIQADAGTRTAAITGSWIALRHACNILLKEGELLNDPIKGQVAAVSVGSVRSIPLLDLNYKEDSIADVDLNVVMDAEGKFLEIQGTAERQTFSKTQLDEFLQIAELGIKKLLEKQLCFLKMKD